MLGLMASRMFRGTKKDYLLASHSIGPFLLLMSLFGTTMTAFALVGSSGEAFKEGIGVYGMLASSSGIIHSLVFFVVGVKLWSLGRRHGYTTQIQYFRDRLDSDFVGILLFPISGRPGHSVFTHRSDGRRNGDADHDRRCIPGFRCHSTIPEIRRWSPALAGLADHLCGRADLCLLSVECAARPGPTLFRRMVFMVLGIVTFYAIASAMGQATDTAGKLANDQCTSRI